MKACRLPLRQPRPWQTLFVSHGVHYSVTLELASGSFPTQCSKMPIRVGIWFQFFLPDWNRCSQNSRLLLVFLDSMKDHSWVWKKNILERYVAAVILERPWMPVWVSTSLSVQAEPLFSMLKATQKMTAQWLHFNQPGRKRPCFYYKAIYKESHPLMVSIKFRACRENCRLI